MGSATWTGGTATSAAVVDDDVLVVVAAENALRTRMPPQFLFRSGKKKIANLPISREKIIYVKLPDTNEYIPIGFGERDVAEAFGCPGKYVDDY